MSSRDALSAAAAIASGESSVPTSSRAASRASTGPVADAQIDQPRLAAPAGLVERHQGGDAYLGVVAMAAGDLQEGPAGAGGRRRDGGLDQHLVRLQRGGEQAGEEVGGGHPALAGGALRRKRARRATATAGSSAAGSAWARLPPSVPRLRICGWAMKGIVLVEQRRHLGHQRVALQPPLPGQGAEAQGAVVVAGG